MFIENTSDVPVTIDSLTDDVFGDITQVQGDITAPRVVLEDGANFRGGVEMGEPVRGDRHRGAGRAEETKPATSPSAVTGGATRGVDGIKDATKDSPKAQGRDATERTSGAKA